MNYKDEAIRMLEQGREVYPLHDIDGNITGIVGRNPFLIPKYIVRGTGFFGNFNTEEDTIIITEGIMDVLIAQTQKHNNVVTFSGTVPEDNFTDDVLARIAEMNKKIIIFLDNDELGQKNAKALRGKMEECGIDVYLFQSDWAKDMTEFLSLSNRTFEDIIKV